MKLCLDESIDRLEIDEDDQRGQGVYRRLSLSLHITAIGRRW